MVMMMAKKNKLNEDRMKNYLYCIMQSNTILIDPSQDSCKIKKQILLVTDECDIKPEAFMDNLRYESQWKILKPVLESMANDCKT